MEERQFELNLTLGTELIAGLKTAAGLDVDNHKDLQQGSIKARYKDQELSLEVRSQGFFGGEKLYLLKRSVATVNFNAKQGSGKERLKV